MITPELKTYIRQQLGAGVAQDAIRKNLFAKAWDMQDVDDAFVAIASENPQSAQAPVTQQTPATQSAQQPAQEFVQPIKPQSHKGIWATAIILILILLCAAGAYAAYAYGMFTPFTPIPAIQPVATTTPTQSDSVSTSATTTTPNTNPEDFVPKDSGISATSSVKASEDTTIIVTDKNSPIEGARVFIPKNSAKNDLEVEVGYDNNLPGPINADAVAIGTVQVSSVIVLRATNGEQVTFNRTITVTLPYDTTPTNGRIPPVIVYWDDGIKKYIPVTTTDIDRVNGNVTFITSHFGKFVALVVSGL